MRDRTIRLLLAVNGVLLGVVGVWAGFAPRSFYDDFPGFGRVWVSVDGPYNEHLVRDVGTLNLALAVVTLLAAAWLLTQLVQAAAVALLVNAVPHLVYHLRHADVLESTDRWLSPATLVVAVVVPVVVLVLASHNVAGREPSPGRR